MVEIATSLKGWTQLVYKFGCAFIHLSNFHNQLSANPFDNLEKSERSEILHYMRQYHGGPEDDQLSVEVLAAYIPKILKKISGNLECELKELEKHTWTQAGSLSEGSAPETAD